MEKKQIKKINLNELKNVLSSKEMKNVKGGSTCKADCGIEISGCSSCAATENCVSCNGQLVCC